MNFKAFTSNNKIEYKLYETKHGDALVRQSTIDPTSAIMTFSGVGCKIENYDDKKIEDIINIIEESTKQEMFLALKMKNFFGYKKQAMFTRGEDASDLRMDTKTNGRVLFYNDSKFLMYPMLNYEEKVKSLEEAMDKVNDNDEGLSIGFKVKAISKALVSKKNRFRI